jgi:DNA topoisomerase-2
VHIKELPIGRWIKDHKEFLEELMEKDDRIVGFKEYHTRLRVHFEIEMKPETIAAHRDE